MAVFCHLSAHKISLDLRASLVIGGLVFAESIPFGGLERKGLDMPLTDTAVRHAKPKDKPFKMADMLGLYILVLPSGGKHWKMKYRFDGHEKKLSFGQYPRVSLREARRQRDEARDSLSKGVDPAYEKQREKLRAKVLAENTFTAIKKEYCNKRRRDGDKAWAPATAVRCEYLLSLLDNSIGKMPVHLIEPIDVLAAVRKIEAKGKLESARRTLQLAGAVFRYAVATARLKSDPTRDLRGALINPTVTHYGAITDAKAVGALLRAIDGYQSQSMTNWALKLAPHVFVRPGELRTAQWEEFDLEARVWTIPAEKMKMRKPHHVPLSRQSIAILEEIRSITGPWSYLFPSLRSRKRPMSDNTLNAALRRMGYASNEMTAHGFRAMASTLLNESCKWSYDAIERALAHGDNNRVRAAYHRGAHWDERVAMAQWWSDYLDDLRHDLGRDKRQLPPNFVRRSSQLDLSAATGHDVG
jgi:integrase